MKMRVVFAKAFHYGFKLETFGDLLDHELKAANLTKMNLTLIENADFLNNFCKLSLNLSPQKPPHVYF